MSPLCHFAVASDVHHDKSYIYFSTFKIIIILVSPLCHFAVASDVHHDKSEADIGNTANECQQHTSNSTNSFN